MRKKGLESVRSQGVKEECKSTITRAKDRVVQLCGGRVAHREQRRAAQTRRMKLRGP